MVVSPTVSVIIPSYNHAAYLPQRIESILHQTYTDFELIILDDCSPDNSREIIGQYAASHANIQAVFNEVNSGSTFFQWKKGLALAKGKYLWIAESDDFAEPTFLAQLVPLLEADATIALAYCNSTVVDENNRPMGTTATWKNESFQTTRWNDDFLVDGQTEFDRYLSKTCTINNASSVVFRKQAMLDAGGVDTGYRFTGDWMMYQKLCLQGRIAYTGACLSNYREHGNNASKQDTDSKALLERQKCFAFAFDKVLNPAAKEELLQLASREFVAISYNMLRRTWKPMLLLNYIRQISTISIRYYGQVQLRTFQLAVNRTQI